MRRLSATVLALLLCLLPVLAQGESPRLTARALPGAILAQADRRVRFVLLGPGGQVYPIVAPSPARRLVVRLGLGWPGGHYTVAALTDFAEATAQVIVGPRRAVRGVTPLALAVHYRLGSLYARGLLGQGTKIAIYAPSAPSEADVARFDRIFALPPAQIRYLNCDPYDQEGWAARAEADIDVEWAHAVAPLAEIELICPFGAVPPDPSAVALAPAEAALHGAVAFSVSLEWPGIGYRSLAESGDPYLFLPVPKAHPIAVLAASGDEGRLGPAWPQDDPHVLAVGGTMWRGGKTLYWQDGRLGGGYGGSDWPRPSWQDIGAPVRRIPDFSLNAADFFDVVDGHLGISEGTSFSAPIAAAIVALVAEEARRSGRGTLPFLNPLLYELAASPYGRLAFGRGGRGSDVYHVRTGLGVPDVLALDFFLVRGRAWLAGAGGALPVVPRGPVRPTGGRVRPDNRAKVFRRERRGG